MLIDINNKVRYLDIQVIKGVNLNDTGYLLIPVGLATLGIDNDKVLIDLDSSRIKNYPKYNGKIITKEYENSIFQSLRNEKESNPGKDFYSHSNYNDNRFFSREDKREL